MAGLDGMDGRFCDFLDDEAEDPGELEELKVTVEEPALNLKDFFCTRTGGHTKQMKLNLIDAAYEQTDKLEELAAPDDKPFFQRVGARPPKAGRRRKSSPPERRIPPPLRHRDGPTTLQEARAQP